MTYESSKETKEYFVLQQLKYKSIGGSRGMGHTFTGPTDGPPISLPGNDESCFLVCQLGSEKVCWQRIDRPKYNGKVCCPKSDD